jgi:hypothetical protein
MEDQNQQRIAKQFIDLTSNRNPAAVPRKMRKEYSQKLLQNNPLFQDIHRGTTNDVHTTFNPNIIDTIYNL